MQNGDLLATKRDGLSFGRLGEGWVHLCVDMQRMFAEETPWTAAWMPRVLPTVVALVELAPERSIFTRFVPPRSFENVQGTWRRYYERWQMMTRERLDSDMIELAPPLRRFVPPARTFDKLVYSPWFDGRLWAQLSRLSVDTLVISGAETEVCVLSTVLGAIDLGFRVIIATDAICSSADSTHDAMLEIYHSRFGMQVETASSAEILEAA